MKLIKGKLKNGIITGVLLVALSLVVAIPAFANSSTWNITMKLRVVNGKDNKTFFSLSKGKAYIKGRVGSVKYMDKGSNSPLDVYVTLYRSKTGADVEYNSVDIGTNQYFDDKKLGTVGVNSDQYYLLFWKGEVDGFKVTANGTVHN